jgi:hypothetical protein
MQYTEKENAMLQENTARIIAFLDELKPNVRETISITFYTDRYGGTPHIINLSSHRITGSVGYVSIKFEEDDTSRDQRDIFKCFDYMARLCHNWKTIKIKIMSEIEYQQELVSAIDNFEL